MEWSESEDEVFCACGGECDASGMVLVALEANVRALRAIFFGSQW